MPAHRALPEALAAGDAAFCRSCGADIIWAITPKGARHPYDPDGASHFGTCPDANSWSKKGKR